MPSAGGYLRTARVNKNSVHRVGACVPVFYVLSHSLAPFHNSGSVSNRPIVRIAEFLVSLTSEGVGHVEGPWSLHVCMKWCHCMETVSNVGQPGHQRRSKQARQAFVNIALEPTQWGKKGRFTRK